MNLVHRDIQYFLAVAKTGRLAQAAETCRVTQPALTKAIRRLETELGMSLFERHVRGMRITPSGLRFLEVAEGVSAQYESAMRLTAELRAQEAGMLRIGITDISRSSLVSPAIAQLLPQRPGLRVRLRVGRSDLLAAAVFEGELDAAIVPKYEGHEFAGCDCLTIGSDPFIPIVRSGHPLTQRPQLTLADLHPYSWVLSDRMSMSNQTVNAVFARAELPVPVVAVETEYASELVLNLVRNTDSITMIPQSLLRAADHFGLQVLPLPDLHIPRAVVFLTRVGSVMTPLMAAFRESVVIPAAVSLAP